MCNHLSIQVLGKISSAAAILLFAVIPQVGVSADISVEQRLDALQRGAEILLPVKLELVSALQTALPNGVESAIEVCSIQAPAIAESHSDENVRMGRTSHRLRNPENSVPLWAESTLDQFVDGELGQSPQVVSLSEGRVGYLEPIFVQEICLACHGTAVAESVQAQLAKFYPEDRAIGFSEGDFRGLFWAEFDIPSAQE